MKSASEFLEALKATELTWIVTHQNPCLFEALFQGEHVQLHLNDFPDEPMLTIFYRGLEIDLEESPRKWHLQHRD